MDASEFTSIGVGGIFGLYVIDRLFNFLRRREESGRGSSGGSNGWSPRLGSRLLDLLGQITSTTEKTASDVTELRKIHEQRDSDGTPFVFTPRSMVRTLENLNKLIEIQTTLLGQIKTRLQMDQSGGRRNGS